MERGLSGLARKKKKERSGTAETVRTLVVAVLIAIVIRTVAFEPFNIPSASMVPTLLIGDYLFVSKYSYGYSRYSLPFGVPPLLRAHHGGGGAGKGRRDRVQKTEAL